MYEGFLFFSFFKSDDFRTITCKKRNAKLRRRGHSLNSVSFLMVNSWRVSSSINRVILLFCEQLASAHGGGDRADQAGAVSNLAHPSAMLTFQILINY